MENLIKNDLWDALIKMKKIMDGCGMGEIIYKGVVPILIHRCYKLSSEKVLDYRLTCKDSSNSNSEKDLEISQQKITFYHGLHEYEKNNPGFVLSKSISFAERLEGLSLYEQRPTIVYLIDLFTHFPEIIANRQAEKIRHDDLCRSLNSQIGQFLSI